MYCIWISFFYFHTISSLLCLRMRRWYIFQNYISNQHYISILVSKPNGACYTLQSPNQIGSAREKRRVFFGIAVIVVKFWVTAIKKKQCLIISQNDVTLKIASTPFIVKCKVGRKTRNQVQITLDLESEILKLNSGSITLCYKLQGGEKKSQKPFWASNASSDNA